MCIWCLVSATNRRQADLNHFWMSPTWRNSYTSESDSQQKQRICNENRQYSVHWLDGLSIRVHSRYSLQLPLIVDLSEKCPFMADAMCFPRHYCLPVGVFFSKPTPCSSHRRLYFRAVFLLLDMSLMLTLESIFEQSQLEVPYGND